MIIRISEAGGCARKIQLQYQGVEGLPLWEGTLRAFEEGHIHEPSILDWAKDNLPGAPYELKDCQREVHIEDFLEGHIDGILKNNLGEVLVEAKALSRRGFQELREKGVREAHPQYFTQVQLYLYALNLERGWLVARNKETPKNQLWDMHTELINLERNFAKSEIERLRLVAKAIESGEDIAPPYNPETDWHCKPAYCIYANVCWPGYHKEIKKLENKEELIGIVNSYAELCNQIKELEQERDGLKEIILSSVNGSAKIGDWLVEVVERRSERFDTVLAKKTLPPDLLAKLIKISTYKTLNVKR